MHAEILQPEWRRRERNINESFDSFTRNLSPNADPVAQLKPF